MLIGVLVSVVSGCSYFRGVVREAELTAPLDATCIERAVAQTEGVTNVRARSEVQEGRAMFFWYSRVDVRVIEYDAPSVSQASVGVANEDDGSARFGQSIWVPFPEEQDDAVQVTAALERMRSIERSVETQCDVALTNIMRTHCQHVSCDVEMEAFAGEETTT